ncbi:MAG: murein biosynthesis integral membrane protein MurJ [Bacillota bacterium]|nr:murein biosynthesis integral membrane protein MurJ [Bacillota bacterium]
MASREGLFKAAGIIVFVSIVSKLLGFARETSLAAVFGATYATDAYLVGQTIPMLVFAAVGAALGNTFIPVFSQVRRDRGREAAFRMASSVINATVVLSLACVLVGEAFAGPLARLVAPGFQGPVHALTVTMSRIMFPMVLFQGLSGILTGMLQTEGNFAVPALVSLAFNAVLIASILGLGPVFGIGAVAAGTVVAVAAQALLQMPALARLGYKWEPVVDFRDPGLRRIGALVGPVLLATAVGQLGLVVDRVLASGLAEGSVAALNYGNRLMGLVPGVFGLAIITVMFPTLAGFAAARDFARFGRAFAEAAKMINFILVPAAVGMAVLRVPLVRLAFERGAFDARATEATAWALLFFCVGVSVFTLRDMVSRAFFALQDTTTPMIVGAASVGINIVLNLLLVGPLKHGGLALATSLAGVFGVAVLLWMLRERVRALGAMAPTTTTVSTATTAPAAPTATTATTPMMATTAPAAASPTGTLSVEAATVVAETGAAEGAVAGAARCMAMPQAPAVPASPAQANVDAPCLTGGADTLGLSGGSAPRQPAAVFAAARLDRTETGSPPGIGGRAILSSLWRVVLASAVMGVLVQLSYPVLEARVPGGSIPAQAVRLFGAVAVGIVSYAALVWVLRVPEARLVLDTTRKVLQQAIATARRRCKALVRA